MYQLNDTMPSPINENFKQP